MVHKVDQCKCCALQQCQAARPSIIYDLGIVVDDESPMRNINRVVVAPTVDDMGEFTQLVPRWGCPSPGVKLLGKYLEVNASRVLVTGYIHHGVWRVDVHHLFYLYRAINGFTNPGAEQPGISFTTRVSCQQLAVEESKQSAPQPT